MYLIILFEGKLIHFYQVETTKNEGFKITKNSILNLELNGLTGDEYYRLDKLVPLIKNEVKSKGYKRKNVKIVINNRQLIYRELTVPDGDETQTQTMVTNEMILSLNLSNDYVVSYIDLGVSEESGTKQRRVFASAILESICQEYLSLMKKCDLKCNSIQTGTDNIIQFLKKTSKEEVTLFIEYNHDVIRNFLFENGNFILSRTTRLDSEIETAEEFVQTISENVAKMDQFQFTRNRYQRIEKIEVFGHSKHLDHFTDLPFEGNRAISLIDKPSELSTVESYYAFVSATCILFAGNAPGFYSIIKSKSRKKEKITNVHLRKVIKTAIIATVVTVLSFASMFGYNYYKETQYNERNQIILDMSDEYAKASALVNKASTYGNLSSIAENLMVEKTMMIKYTQEIYDILFGYGSVTISGLDFSNGILTINAKTGSVGECSEYAKRLVDSHKFSEVSYTGFTSNDDTYIFVMDAIMEGAVIVDEVE